MKDKTLISLINAALNNQKDFVQDNDKFVKDWLKSNDTTHYIEVADGFHRLAVKVDRNTLNKAVRQWHTISNDYAAQECNEFLHEKNK